MIVSQAIEEFVCLQVVQKRRSLFDGFVEPLKGLVLVAQPGINDSDSVGIDVLRLFGLQQSVQDASSVVSPAGDGIKVSKKWVAAGLADFCVLRIGLRIHTA